MKIGRNEDGTIDEVFAMNAQVHLEDMGGAYMLIVVADGKHLHLTIPTGDEETRAFVYEEEDTQ